MVTSEIEKIENYNTHCNYTDFDSYPESKNKGEVVGDIVNGKKKPIYVINLLSLQPAELMLIKVAFNKKICLALIDSGASVSIIKRSKIPDYVPLLNCDHCVSGLCGTVQALGELHAKPIVPGLVLAELRFIVVPDDTITHDVILGADFLTNNGLSVDMSRKALDQCLSGGRCQVYFANSGTPEKSLLLNVPVYATEDVNLTSCEPTLVRINMADSLSEVSDSMCLFESVSASSTRVGGSCGIVSVQRGATQVMMSAERPTLKGFEHLKKGSVVGSVSTVVELPVDEESSNAVSKHWNEDAISAILSLPDLSDNQRSEVVKMLLEKSDVLSRGDDDVGLATVTKHRIELYEDTPICQKVRRFPEPVVEAIEKQCDELEMLDIIEPSHSPWSSPVVPIRKKDGSIRLCVDYRKLNAVTKPDRFPMPSLNDLVFGLHGMSFFTSLDLVRGYYQVPLHDESKELTAFSTTRNHYQFKRLSFGLKNAPAAFQREMQTILRGFPVKNVVVYIDDILIMAGSFEEHLQLVGRVLETLRRYGIKVKPSKCHWFRESVPFLGHVVGRDGLQKSPSYVQQVMEFPRPETVGELRQFLGLVNFQRKFLPNCSVVAQPLSRLTGGPKKQKLVWLSDMETAFNELKMLMGKDVALSFPDYRPNASPLELFVDASGYGAGACLMQKQEGCHRVVAYNSMSFSNTQRRYSTIDRELAAMRWGIKSFRSFLYGVPFLLFTDHRPLTYLRNMSNENARISRTLRELEEFDFEIRYCRGVDNVAADYLSRIPCCDREPSGLLDPEYLPDGLRIIRRVEGGGDSMIESLFAVMQHHKGKHECSFLLPSSVEQLRAILVNELLANSVKYGFSLGRNRRREILLMRTPGQMMSEELLTVFSNMYGLEVWVHCGMEKPIVHSMGEDSDSSARRVHLQFLAGVHYNPVEEMSEYMPASVGKKGILPVPQAVAGYFEPELDSDEGLSVCLIAHTRTCSCRHASKASTTLSYGDSRFCALLDTGAQVCLVRESTLKRIGGMLPDVEMEPAEGALLDGVGAGQSSILGVVHLPIVLVGVRLPGTCPFAVVSDDNIPFCFLLGANFILQHKIALDFTRGYLSFVSENEKYSFPLDRTASDVVSLYYCFAHRLGGTSSLLDGPDIEALQLRNYGLRLLRKKVLAKSDPKSWTAACLQPYRRYAGKLSLTDGVLWYAGDLLVPVVHFKFFVGLILSCHYKMGHMGRHKLVNVVGGQAWHPGVDNIAKDVCSSCHWCQVGKVCSRTVNPPVLKLETSRPFELVSVDLVDFPKTPRGHVTILMVVDQFSKWLVAVPLKDKRGESVGSAFESRVLPSLPRRPERVLSDNGPEFRSAAFNGVLDKFGVTHVYTTPYKPSSNGGVERANRTIAQVLRGLQAEASDWDLHVAHAVLVYNHTTHRELNMPPSEFLLGNAHDVDVAPMIPNRIKDCWKEGHPDFVPFRVGQRVLKKIVYPAKLTVNKLKPLYEGPYLVKTVHENGVTYVVERVDPDGKCLSRAVHHSQIKRYVEPPRYIKDHTYFQEFLSLRQSDVSEKHNEDGSVSDEMSSAVEIFLCSSSDEDNNIVQSSNDVNRPVVSKLDNSCFGITRERKKRRRAQYPVKPIVEDLSRLSCTGKVSDVGDIIHSSPVCARPVCELDLSPVLPVSSDLIESLNDIELELSRIADDLEKTLMSSLNVETKNLDISDRKAPQNTLEHMFNDETECLGFSGFPRTDSNLGSGRPGLADPLVQLSSDTPVIVEFSGFPTNVSHPELDQPALGAPLDGLFNSETGLVDFSGFRPDNLGVEQNPCAMQESISQEQPADCNVQQCRTPVERLRNLKEMLQRSRSSIERNRHNYSKRLRSYAHVRHVALFENLNK